MSGGPVLVTGGAGFIGSHVAARYAREGREVRVLDDLSSGSRENLDPAWKLHHASITDPAATAAAVAGCDLVVHLAAFTSVPESFERHAECYRVNVHGTYDLLAACAEARVRRVVFASSSAVYGELPDAPKREDEAPDPISPYAVSKLEGEHLLEIFSARHGLSAVALRFFNVYGPRQAADSEYAAAIAIFLERSLRGEPLTVYGDGRQTRDFVFVGDVVDAIGRAAGSDATGAYNVGSGRPSQVLEVAQTIQDLTGAEPRQHFEATRPGDLRASTADVSRAREQLGWSAQTSLSEGLAKALAWRQRRAEASGQ